MSTFALSCCSTADLTKEHFTKRNISYICFHYTLNGKSYLDDLGDTMSINDFYQELKKDSVKVSTSQVNISEYLDYFTKILKNGQDLLHVCLSSGVSGTINSARNAALIAQERFPNKKIYIVDSLAGSSGFGLLMDKLADLRDKGMDIDKLHNWAEQNKLRVHHWFFSSDLTFFIKGGRISKAAGIFGGLLNICPLMNADNLGRLILRKKVRGRKNAIKESLNKMTNFADNRLNYSDKCYISHSDCYGDAAILATLIENTFTNLNGKVEIYDMGTTMGAHAGPGTVALYFWGDKRKN